MCRYRGSKLQFRGPKRRPEGRNWVAFLGGTETFGKFIPRPFPVQVEAAVGRMCVNLGWSNAGPDVLLRDPGLLPLAGRAGAVVLAVPCACNLSNRYYRVHPRRNDRFVRATARLERLYPEVDFTAFHFTRHLLGHLSALSPARFAVVREELQLAWMERMGAALARLEAPVVLLWFSARAPTEGGARAAPEEDPALVTRLMLDRLAPRVRQVLEVTASPAARAAGTQGMVLTPMEEPAARHMLGPAAHREAAAALAPVVRELLAT